MKKYFMAYLEPSAILARIQDKIRPVSMGRAVV
jgi:hypothetical protein